MFFLPEENCPREKFATLEIPNPTTLLGVDGRGKGGRAKEY